MYAGTTIELCALEKFVHLAGVMAPPLVLVAIDVPEEAALTHAPSIGELPKGWSDLPISGSAQEFGRTWIVAAAALVLLVPSVIVPEALNAVINPRHLAFSRIRLRVVRDFSFDSRMFSMS